MQYYGAVIIDMSAWGAEEGRIGKAALEACKETINDQLEKDFAACGRFSMWGSEVTLNLDGFNATGSGPAWTESIFALVEKHVSEMKGWPPEDDAAGLLSALAADLKKALSLAENAQEELLQS